MNTKTLVVIGCILFGGAVYALHTDKMRVKTVCRDVRLYMDGGIDATIEAGGLNYHRAVNVFRRENRKRIFIAHSDVVRMQGASSADIYAAPDFKLTIKKGMPAGERGTPATLEGTVDSEKISVRMSCLDQI